jgi:hypothetical protein
MCSKDVWGPKNSSVQFSSKRWVFGLFSWTKCLYFYIVGKPWSSTEIEYVNDHFKDNFKNGKLPKKAECEKAAKELDGRTWSNVKDFIRNKIKKSSS